MNTDQNFTTTPRNSNNKKERRRIMELSSPQSNGRAKPKVQLTPVRKIKSRITSKLNNHSFEHNDFYEGDAYSNRATCSSGVDDFEAFTIFQNVNIWVYYYLSNEEKNHINICISEDKTIGELTIICIDKINENWRESNKNIKWNSVDISKYSVKLSNKKGNPKLDFPSFNPWTTLQNCRENTFALVWEGEISYGNVIEMNGEQMIGKNISQSNRSSSKEHKNISKGSKDAKDPTIKKFKINREQGDANKSNDICIVY